MELKSQELRRLAPELDPLRIGTGWKPEDLGKPQIMIESTFGDSHPGSGHLDKLVEAARELAGSEIRQAEAVGELDLALTIAGVRCRVNLFRQQEAWSAAIRLLNEHIPELSELGLPAAAAEFPSLNKVMPLKALPLSSRKTPLPADWPVTCRLTN